MYPVIPCLNTENSQPRAVPTRRHPGGSPTPLECLQEIPVPAGLHHRHVVHAPALSAHVLFVTLTSAKPLHSVKKGHDQLNKFFNQATQARPGIPVGAGTAGVRSHPLPPAGPRGLRRPRRHRPRRLEGPRCFPRCVPGKLHESPRSKLNPTGGRRPHPGTASAGSR